jgi:hypothetical protein
VSDVSPKALKLSSEVSECKSLILGTTMVTTYEFLKRFSRIPDEN